MALQLTYPHIEKFQGFPARLERVPRIRVAQIAMDYLAYGWSPDEMCRQHAYLSQAEAHAAMTYYFDHQDEIDEEIRLETEEAGMSRSSAAHSPFYARMKAKGLL
jgi:uncharacterized protein (DUF433 family)